MPTFTASLLPLLAASVASLGGAISPDPEPGTVVAEIGQDTITFGALPDNVRTDLARAELRYRQKEHQLALDHQRQRQALLEARAGNYLDSQLLRREAEAQGISVEDLVKKVQPPPITDAALRAFYDSNAKRFNQPFEAVQVSILQHLTQQAVEQEKRRYLDGLRAKYHGRLTVAPLRESVVAEGPSRGPASATVTILEFADFQCPYCAELAPRLEQLLEHYPHDVRLVYRQMPLSNLHPDALHAAEASLCAGEQGKFWDMHHALFADQKALSVQRIKATAARLKLAPQKFEACLDSGSAAARVTADSEAAIDYGVEGTPALFINGRFFSGSLSYERLVAIVEEELGSRTPPSVAATH